jgi:hypothetical protein
MLERQNVLELPGEFDRNLQVDVMLVWLQFLT